MTCNHCAQEFDSSVRICPNCGRTLVYGAAGPTTGGERRTPNPPQFDLGDSSGASAPALGSTMSVSGSSSIRARLRPRGFFSIFGESFRLYFENWKLFWRITLAFYVPFTIFSLLWGILCFQVLGPPVQGDWMSGLVEGIPNAILSYVAVFLVFWGIIRAVSDKYLGRNVTFAETVTPTRRIWGLVGTAALATLIVIGPLLVAAFIFGMAMQTNGPGAQGVGNPGVVLAVVAALFASMIFAVIALVFLCISGSVAVIEGCGAVGSLRRSAKLIRGFAWRGFFILLLAWLVVIVISVGVELIALPFALPLVHAGGFGPINLMSGSALLGVSLMAIAEIVFAMIAAPAFLLPLVVFYYDLRVRKEAFDLQMLAEQLGYGYQDPGSGLASA